MAVSKVGYIRDNFFLEKLVRNKLFWVVFFFLGFSYPILRSINRTLPPDLPVFFQLPEYQLRNEQNEPFGSDDLKGRPYIASFMFRNCPSTCPALMEKMQKVQKRVRGLGTSVALVSYTVDPENDTPAVLYKYARELKASPHVWTFLTGTSSELRSLLVDGFKVPMGELMAMKGIVDRKELELFDIAHSEKFVLVDHEGAIRGYYSTDTDSINKLMIDLGLLVNKIHHHDI